MTLTHKKPFLESIGKRPFLEGYAPPAFLTHEEKTRKLMIPDDIRPQAMYIAGNPGYGKSSLIQNLVISDMRAGYGVCVIDPSGDLIRKRDASDAIIDWIPENRLDDVIYFNTSDSVKSFDFFSYHDDDERRVLIDELTAIFKLENAPRAKPLLKKIIGILFAANRNGGTYTFLDIQTFIENEAKQREILRRAKIEWHVPKPIEFDAITTRLIPFTEDPVLKVIVASEKPEINIWDIMQNNKILLVDLQDTETDHFIGALITAQIQQATFRRRILRKEDRKLFFLYVDEFHAITPSGGEHFATILTRARKYNLCLTFANPLPDDLPAEIMRKLPSVAVKILFNLNASNASVFKDQLVPYVSMEGELQEPETFNYLNSLRKFTAVCVQPHQYPTLVTTPRFLPPNPASCAHRLLKRPPGDAADAGGHDVMDSKDDAPGAATGDADMGVKDLLPYKHQEESP
jgi:hypothetical protein